MPLWLSTGPVEDAKPKWLTATEKAATTAEPEGWVYTQPDGTEEVLVAIADLDQTVTIT